MDLYIKVKCYKHVKMEHQKINYFLKCTSGGYENLKWERFKDWVVASVGPTQNRPVEINKSVSYGMSINFSGST